MQFDKESSKGYERAVSDQIYDIIKDRSILELAPGVITDDTHAPHVILLLANWVTYRKKSKTLYSVEEYGGRQKRKIQMVDVDGGGRWWM